VSAPETAAFPAAGLRRVEDFALLGGNRTAALVHRDGSVDWWPVPRFDSPAVFAALVGTVDNGCWRLTSAETPREHTRRYRGDTLILETDVATSAGKVRLVASNCIWREAALPIRTGDHSELGDDTDAEASDVVHGADFMRRKGRKQPVGERVLSGGKARAERISGPRCWQSTCTLTARTMTPPTKRALAVACSAVRPAAQRSHGVLHVPGRGGAATC